LGLRDLFLLRPDVIFLNHGSFGACPRPVFDEYQRWQIELERQPVEFLGRRFRELMRTARSSLARYVGADPTDLIYVANATTGVNVIARSLDLGPDDEVLTTNHEYGAVDRTWRFVCGHRGASYVVQPIAVPVASANDFMERLWSSVTPRTRVISLSHITSPTAITFPIEPVIRRAREAGILTVIDGAHGPGQLDLDLRRLAPDFYVGNCHKWLCAPKGAAFLYARKDVQALLQPLVVSWGWQADPDWEAESPFITALEWQGAEDIAPYLAVPAAIRFLEDHDWAAVRQDCHQLVRQARSALLDLTGQAALTPDSSDWFCQMAAVPLPPCDGAELKRKLYDEHRVEVPIIEWQGMQLLRVSVQGYNTAADVEQLRNAVRQLLPTVLR